MKDKPHEMELKSDEMPAMYQYAAKFVCGKTKDKVVAPGKYFTAINVHNPHYEPVYFKKKVAVALPSEKAGPVSPWYRAKLGPDEAFEIDCPDIKSHARDTVSKFLKGFVVIETDWELDIVAVYSTAVWKTEELEIERVEPRTFPRAEKVEPESGYCPDGGRGDGVGEIGCCCNKPKTTNPMGPQDWWPDCRLGLTCVGNVGDSSLPTSTYAVCANMTRPGAWLQSHPIHWSQPAYCGQRAP